MIGGSVARADDPFTSDDRAPASRDDATTDRLVTPVGVDQRTIPQPRQLDDTQTLDDGKHVVRRGDVDVVEGEVVVLFRDAESFLNDNGHRRVGTVVRENPLINMRVLRVANVDAAIKALQRNPHVEHVEANTVVEGEYDPNDPIYRNVQNSWHLREWSYARGTNVRAAWDTQAGAAGARIVIIDTGIDMTHPDLQGRIAGGYNFSGRNTNYSDCNGHGTQVAGVTAAIANNSRGVAGVDMRAGIYVARVGIGCTGSWDGAALADAIATTSAWGGTRVINVSGGTYTYSAALQRAVDLARSRNVVVVAAAGNDSSNQAFYPAALDGVLGVGATDWNAQRADFGNGKGSNWGTLNVKVSAPGKYMCTTTLVSLGSYTCVQGTSFAAPLVAGIAMLARAQYPSKGEATIRAQLQWASWNPGRNCWNCASDVYGFGIVQALAVVTSQR